jgi:hypothetical protein
MRRSVGFMQLVCSALILAAAFPVSAQPPAAVRLSARDAAPVDLTGQWVSVVSEDWRWRMVTPIRGDFASLPLKARARRVAMEWDPARDEAARLECKAYGAPAIMRIPGRVRISWEDQDTLKIETDAGMQTRLFHFDAPGVADEPPSRQGFSVANWEQPVRGIGATQIMGGFSRRTGREGRSLEVTTTNLMESYLRKNGVPLSERAAVREYYDLHAQPNGDEWFTVTTVITDPINLQGAFITSSDFSKDPNPDRWNPTPCAAR